MVLSTVGSFGSVSMVTAGVDGRTYPKHNENSCFWRDVMEAKFCALVED